MDRNRDGVVTRAEWTAPAGAFRLHDGNHDGVLSGTEVWDNRQRAREVRNDDRANNDNWNNRFRDMDRDNDGLIARREWRESSVNFRALDDNQDGRLTRAEFRNRNARTEGSTAFNAGYQRGLIEGRAAGREDRDRNHGWDLNGQRELESADSGYDSRFGPKIEYQSGYREGFRIAYQQGWDRR